MDRWFGAGCSVADVKREYRRLAKLHHPDLGGDVELMKRINLAYAAALSGRDGEVSAGADGREHVYRYDAEIEEELMVKIRELLLIPGVVVDLVGVWLWIGGDTRPVRDALKSAGCIWHGKRGKWYWRVSSGRRRRMSRLTYDELCDVYGVREFVNDAKGVL